MLLTSGSAPSREEVFHVELRVWLFLALVLIMALALLLIITELYVTRKRVAELETRIVLLDMWADCVDKAVDPVIALKIQANYVERTRKIVGDK